MSLSINRRRLTRTILHVSILVLSTALSACGGGGGVSDTGTTGGVTSLAGTDTTPPRVLSSAPSGGASNVATNTVVRVTFSEAIEAASVGSSSVTLSPVVPGAISVSGSEVRFTPTGLAAGTSYRVTVQGVRDLSGNALATSYSFNFTTAAAVSLSCTQTSVRCVGSGQEYSTIQAAVDAAQAGDTVLVYDGNYAGFHITNKSGTSSAPITIRTLGNNAVIDRADAGGDGILFSKASYIIVDGFTIQGRNSSGTQMISQRCVAGHNATPTSPMIGNIVRNINCSDAALECFYLSEFNSALIENNTILRCGRAGGTRNHGIYLANAGSDNTVIRGNAISGGLDAGAESNGIHMNGDLSVGGDGLISGLTIEGNTIYANAQNGLNMDGVQSSLVRNNLIYDNARNGLRAYAIDGAAGPTNMTIVNNTFVATASGWAVKLTEDLGGHTVFNNILIGSSGALCVANDNVKSDRNALVGGFSRDGDTSTITLTQWRTAIGEDNNSVATTTSALFASGSYQLSTNSPARDNGVTSFNSIAAPATDIVGEARPQGAAVDMGAYEQ